MCATCGCGGENEHGLGRHLHDERHHEHDHGHEHHHEHHHREPPAATVLSLEQRILARNDAQAVRNREWLSRRGILAVNLMSSPGAGKTTLLERTLRDGALGRAVQVIEGDQATDNDARRIRAAGARAVQVNTGAGCHLDAAMVERALRELEPDDGSVVFIENVGNLVCPALFDLGEHVRVVVASVTEGDDKPAKYPHMFRASHALVLNKTDLLPHVSFGVERFEAMARSMNPRIELLHVSATRGDGMEAWYGWLRSEVDRGAP